MYLFANTMEFGQEKVKGSQKDSKQVFEWSSYIGHQNPSPTQCFFFSIFSCCTKTSNQPPKDLAKFGYKMNKEVENLGILLYVGERVQSIN